MSGFYLWLPVVFTLSTASVVIYGCETGLSEKSVWFCGSYSAAMGRYPPFPLMPTLNTVWDLMWKIVRGGQQCAGKVQPCRGKELERTPAHWAAPSPGLFDVPVRTVHRQGPLQEQDIQRASEDLCGRFAPRFNLLRQEVWEDMLRPPLCDLCIF